MSNLVLLWRNRTDEAVITSPGSWQTPLANLQTRILSEVARTAGTDRDDTKIVVDLGQVRPIRGIVLANNNLTTAARYRITARRYAGDAKITYDSGWQEVYRRLYSWGELRWGDPNFWFGRPSTEDLDGFTRSLIHVLPDITDAAHWTIELDDEDNSDRHLQVGRLFIAGGSQPSHNYSAGASLGYTSETRIDRSRTGVKFFDRREPLRVMRFSLELLPEQEALERWLEIQRRMGMDGEVFIIPDPEDDQNMTRRAFLGTLKSLSSWDQVLYQRASIQFEIEEVL